MIIKGKEYLGLIMFFGICWIPLSGPGQTSLPPELWSNAGDYTFMYFPQPLTETSEFHIQTNYHFLAFDYLTLQLKDIRIITNPLPEQEAVTRDLEFLPLQDDERNLLTFGINYQGQFYKLVKGASSPKECQLVESGKYFQRRLLTNLGFEPGAPAADVHMEISSWPDRINISLEVLPDVVPDSGWVEARFEIPEALRENIIDGGENILAADATGNGFLFFAPVPESALELVDTIIKITRHLAGEPAPHLDFSLIPVFGYKGQPLQDLILNEVDAIGISCDQITPLSTPLTTLFDRKLGCQTVTLRNDGRTYDRIERVNLTLNNPSGSERTARLVFSKPSPMRIFGITGISAMIRDRDHYPSGIPVQLSKNWHHEVDESEFVGPWFRGFTMLNIPAGISVDLEFTLVNGYWGKVPAASHNQLSLVGWDAGWGDNQLWDQAAIGSWGETVCFNPEGSMVESMVCDVRPLMIKSTDPSMPKPEEFGWTPNVGGADLFRFYDQQGEKQPKTRIKSYYRRYCPNLTEVTYAGVTADYEAEFSLTTSIFRTDDYVRVIYRINLSCHKPIDFSRLAIIQVGTDTYARTSERKFAFGDENGLIEEWDTQWGGSAYRKAGLHADGTTPWISLHESVIRYPDEWGAWANRGLVVRKWNAVIDGDTCKPYFSEYGSVVGGVPTSLAEINPPPGVKRLQPGDFIEAEIVHLIIPQKAVSYYGTNDLLSQFLQKHEDTWRPVYREATANNPEIVTSKGTLLHDFPVVIKVSDQNQAEIEITGGLGYVPVTFTGLTSHTDFDLRINKNGENIFLADQENHGKDYWQTDYDALDSTWEITYSVPLDPASEYGGQEGIIIYNDFDKNQYIPWSDPINLRFTDKEDNPSITHANPALKVAKAISDSGLLSYVHFQLPDYPDLSEHNTFKIKTYYKSSRPVPENCRISLILRNNGADSTQYSITRDIVSANTWEEMIFEYPDAHEKDDYNQVLLYFSTPGQDSIASSDTFYIDQLMGPPLTIDPDKLDFYTSVGGDSVIIDFSGNDHLLEKITSPFFTLKKNSSEAIKIRSVTHDSCNIYLLIGENSEINGRDDLSLSFTFGEITDEIGRMLPWFESRKIINNTPMPPLSLRFIIADLKTKNRLAGITITIDTTVLETNMKGETIFALDPGEYHYTISGQDYIPIDSAIVLESDTSLSHLIRSSIAYIKFRISEGISPVYQAVINLDGEFKQTNSIGLALFEDLEVYREYPLSISKYGYYKLLDTIYLTADTILEYTIDLMSAAERLTWEGLSIFPVPASHQLVLESDGIMKVCQLISITGAVVYESKINSRRYTVKLSGLNQGIYTIRVKYSNGSEINRKFTVIRQ